MADQWKTMQGVVLVLAAFFFLLSGLGAFQFSYGRTQNDLEILLAFIFIAIGLAVLFSNK
jgi:hypothetical protein